MRVKQKRKDLLFYLACNNFHRSLSLAPVDGQTSRGSDASARQKGPRSVQRTAAYRSVDHFSFNGTTYETEYEQSDATSSQCDAERDPVGSQVKTNIIELR